MMRAVTLAAAAGLAAAARPSVLNNLPKIAESIVADKAAGGDGEHWAMIMAGSNSWGNYRHQADAYHAYQIFAAAGVPDDHIVMMHYDDIAGNQENPMKGQVINNPGGKDVYANVPKDYTGSDVTAANFVSILTGDSSSPPSGGSGKVVASGPKDKVFVAFFDHGGPGILGVPEGTGPYLYAKDVNDALQAKHDAGGFAELTFYIEACESGSIFDGLLPADINVYATTAANPSESSWGYYCPGMTPAPPAEFNTCLGDLYAISWMENVDSADTSTESLLDQYNGLVQRVSQNGTFSQGSHVMQYGDLSIDAEMVDAFIGTASAKKDAAPAPAPRGQGVEQRDADLHSMYWKYTTAAAGSPEKEAAFAVFSAETQRRAALDKSAATVADLLLSKEQQAAPVATPVVTDWDCYKTAVSTFEAKCASLSQYGLKHAGILAKACNAGKTTNEIASAVVAAC